MTYKSMAVPTNPLLTECAAREITLLRQELHNLKHCQISFLTIAFTSTGVLLGLVPKLFEVGLKSYGFLTPLVVILPASLFFFDKARTVTRIVGYYRWLEHHLNPRCTFPAWENALALTRWENETRGQWHCFVCVMLRLQYYGYWALAFYTFFGLAAVCLAGAWIFALHKNSPSDWCIFVLILSSIITAICMFKNAIAVRDLTIGDSSYQAQYDKWRGKLGLSSETEPDAIRKQ